ncbi:MAG: hypothetical protein K6F30_01385 [Lachnospiraceae bacterium]|nr:hypothetical protein [Lachnospiraceae bacterium]
MIEKKLHDLSEEYGISFENLLANYLKEIIIATLCEKGYGSCLCLKDPKALSMERAKGRSNRNLLFLYKEDERILANDGFVPGCPFSAHYMEEFYQHILCKLPQVRIDHPEIGMNYIKFEAFCENMYVPFFLEIKDETMEGFTPNQEELILPITNKTYEMLTYPLEQEAAVHLGAILKDLELINEMEHYFALYHIFSKETIEGVRLQNGLEGVLKKEKISFMSDRFDTVLSYRDYSYMKKKWKVLLRRQKTNEPSWEEVVDILEKVVVPIWNTSKEDMIFFGDWMPEIGRYLD